MLAQFEEFNRDIEEKIAAEPEYDWRRDYLLLGTDVVSLFPSLSAENTAHAVRKTTSKEYYLLVSAALGEGFINIGNIEMIHGF